MKKFAILISSPDIGCKRSLTFSQIEVLWVICASSTIEPHRKYFNLTMAFYAGEFNKAVTVKRLPIGYLAKFKMQKP